MARDHIHSGNDHGFTLIDLLVALSILAVGSAVLLPRISFNRPAVATEALAYEVMSILRQARAAAMTSARPQPVIIDDAARSILAPGAAKPRILPPGLEMAVDLPDKGAAPAGPASIRFFPDGSSTGGAIRLSSKRAVVTVSVDHMTGQIRVIVGR